MLAVDHRGPAGADLHARPAFDLEGHGREELFPGVADTSQPNYWTGLRPSTPTNIPYIGRSRRLGNLWFNCGHGTLGWTHGAGSGHALAELIGGRRPDTAFNFYGV